MKNKFFVFLACITLLFGGVVQATGIENIPSDINISYGQKKIFESNFFLNFNEVSENVLNITHNEENKNEIEITPKETGTLNVSVFGVPIKNVNVNVHTESSVIPGGQSVGVALYTKGALIVGTSNIKNESGIVVNPAKEAGLKTGDIIEKVNGIVVNNADHVIEIINTTDSANGAVLDIIREDKNLTITVYPVKDMSDGSLRLGIWVRDSMAGVGTLSFYNPTTMKYASLGHAIFDSDTKTMLSLKTGDIVECNILGIKQGKEGNPGELQGNLDTSKSKLGTIVKNNDFGIYGTFNKAPKDGVYNDIIKTALIEDIEVGPATILTTIDDEGVKEYDIYIEKLAKQDYPSTKSMVIKVTDPDLISKTGGIIQGMSGSPIIQKGKLVGAVTHVFINDPTKGYGLYAQWMLEQME